MSSNADDYFESLPPIKCLIGCEDGEEDVNFHGINGHNNIQGSDNKNINVEPMSPLLGICLENISNEVRSNFFLNWVVGIFSISHINDYIYYFRQ